MLNDAVRAHSEKMHPIWPWFLLGVVTVVVTCADIPTTLGQALPSGGGPVPPLRRGAGRQIEIVLPSAPPHPEMGQRGTVSVPKATPMGSISHPAATAARIKASSGPAKPMIVVAPMSPHGTPHPAALLPRPILSRRATDRVHRNCAVWRTLLRCWRNFLSVASGIT